MMPIRFIILLSLSFWPAVANAQTNTVFAPLPYDCPKSSNFYTQIDLAEQYWQTNHPDQDGEESGYSVFKRWQYYWQPLIKSDGTFPTNQEMVEKWFKIKSKKNRAGNSSNWTNIPRNIDYNEHTRQDYGRVNVVRLDPSNPNTIYAGTPGGGLWRSKNHGTTWVPMTDFMPFSGVSGIAIHPTDSNIVYIATGDYDIGTTVSHGVYKTTNGGLSWTHLAIPFTLSYYNTKEVMLNPANPNQLFVTSIDGLFRSVDAGQSWTKVINSGISHIRFKPNDPNVIFAAYSDGSQVAKSVDGGITFSPSFVPVPGYILLIDVTPANPDVLYVFNAINTSLSTLYKSSDAGQTYNLQSNSIPLNYFQLSYQRAFCVSPQNENVLFAGCLNLIGSNDGGASWQAMPFLHADIHDLVFQHGKIYCANDGGVYVANLDGSNPNNISFGLEIAQYYSIDLNNNTHQKFTVGAQDNGSYFKENSNWKRFGGGDGTSSATDPVTNNLYYSQNQNGVLFSINSNTSSSNSANVPLGEYSIWEGCLDISPDGRVYAGFHNMYYLDQSNWVPITTGIHSVVRFVRADPTNSNRIFFNREDKLYQLNRSGNNYNLDSMIIPTQNKIINSMAINENNSNNIYIITGWSNILYSNNNGNTWNNLTLNLANDNGLNAIAHEKNSLHNTIYVANNNTIYFKNDTMSQWELFNTNLPNTKYTDLEINANEGYIVTSSYGRGVWRSPVSQASLSTISTMYEDDFVIYPNPASGYIICNTCIDENCSIKLTNSFGQTQFSINKSSIKKGDKIDLTTLVSGIYILDIESRHHLIRRKILISK